MENKRKPYNYLLGVMRPTVPIGEWRIAVDLPATKFIQNQPGTPAFGCTCTWCENWARTWPSVLPEALVEKLQRLRIDPSHPTDLYAFQEVPGGAHCRAVFYVVGKILSGPNAWSEDPKFGRTRIYSMLGNSPQEIGLSITPARETFDTQPGLGEVREAELLQVDFRLYVPLLGAQGGSPIRSDA